MSNAFMNGLREATNYKFTENGGIARKSTNSFLYDMFALGGAYRSRSDEDCILLFKNAYEENPEYALKCLFYLRDARGGQGERRFWRVCMRWLAQADVAAARRNMKNAVEYGRWDDLYVFVGTALENEMFAFLKEQLALDVQCKCPSLLAKWLKSENASSHETRILGARTRKAFGMAAKQYRKTLSILRERINVLERLMSAGRWDEIEFDKIPSKAGLVYRNAFARRDIIKAKYEAFAKSDKTKVNAKTLYPYEVVAKAAEYGHYDDVERAMLQKYWDNLADYFNNAKLNALAVVDTSASMRGTSEMAPINVAISLGMYCAEKANGPFKGHYISFSRQARLIRVEGIDFVDKVRRIYGANLCENTNLVSVFDLVLEVARTNGLAQEELPGALIVISDMEIDTAQGRGNWYHGSSNYLTEIDSVRAKWAAAGYKLPKLIFWNVSSRNNTILDAGPDVSLVSGASPVLFEQIMAGKSAEDLMFDKLNSERYAAVY